RGNAGSDKRITRLATVLLSDEVDTVMQSGCLFFFQAEDGIRDKLVTGVQTCALPISTRCAPCRASAASIAGRICAAAAASRRLRSEERRVGKEGRSRWEPEP